MAEAVTKRKRHIIAQNQYRNYSKEHKKMGFNIGKAIKDVTRGVGNIISDSTGASATAKTQFKNQMALQNHAQEFAKWQMGNAHQEEIKDLEAAGLNPILSAGGGGASASVGGGTASAGTPAGNPVDMILGLLTTAKGVEKTNAEIKNIEADTNQKETDTIWTPKLNKATIDLQNAQTAKAKQEKIESVAKTAAIEFNNKMKSMDIQKRTKEFDKELEIYKNQLELELINNGIDKSTSAQTAKAFGRWIKELSPFTDMTGNSESQKHSTTVNYNTNF